MVIQTTRIGLLTAPPLEPRAGLAGEGKGLMELTLDIRPL